MKYRRVDGWKYELAEDEVCETGIRIPALIDTPLIAMHKDGFLLIMKWYAWDGPSGPAIDSKNFLRASLVHDALYQLIRMKLLAPERRADADRVLQRLCIQDGMSRIRAAWVYYSLRTFGWIGTRPNPRDSQGVQEAP